MGAASPPLSHHAFMGGPNYGNTHGARPWVFVATLISCTPHIIALRGVKFICAYLSTRARGCRASCERSGATLYGTRTPSYAHPAACCTLWALAHREDCSLFTNAHFSSTSRSVRPACARTFPNPPTADGMRLLDPIAGPGKPESAPRGQRDAVGGRSAISRFWLCGTQAAKGGRRAAGRARRPVGLTGRSQALSTRGRRDALEYVRQRQQRLRPGARPMHLDVRWSARLYMSPRSR